MKKWSGASPEAHRKMYLAKMGRESEINKPKKKKKKRGKLRSIISYITVDTRSKPETWNPDRTP